MYRTVMSMPALLALLFDLLLPPAFRSMASGELEELVFELPGGGPRSLDVVKSRGVVFVV